MESNSKGFMYPLLVCLFLAVGLGLDAVSASSSAEGRFDRAFQRFLSEKGYRGGAVAAMKDGRLLLAKGYGLDRAGQEVTSHTSFPVSSLAKSLTAAAVLRLVQDGDLRLDDKVFGDDGILHEIQPFGVNSTHRPDSRIYDVTVEHLLRHTAGWDSEQGPLFDPVFNELYLKRGHAVPNIAKQMDTATPLDPAELISYVMGQKLAFTPGTKVAYSNVGYLVLGRVIEEIVEADSNEDYVAYVKRTILDPCGMWKTRIFPTFNYDLDKVETFDPSTLDSLDLEALVPTLGWYSNVYDIIRFSRCLFDTNTVLDDRHLEILLARPQAAPVQHDHSWHGAGFRTSARNVVWQDADQHADDLILYHNLDPRGVGAAETSDLDTLLPQRADSRTGHLPDSWVVLLFDKSVGHLRHLTRELMTNLAPLEEELLLYPENGRSNNNFLFDLSELHSHPAWNLPGDASSASSSLPMLSVPEFTVRYRVDEHHVTAYINALKAEGFTVHSLSSLTHGGHTSFLVVARRVTSADRVDSDFLFEHGMDHRQLLKRKLQLETAGYNMTLLHSYRSRSHKSHHFRFAAVFRYGAFTPSMEMKYGMNHLPEPYQKLVQMYREKEFFPLSQTVVFQSKDERFSFVFVKRPGGAPVNFKCEYNLSPKKLSRTADEFMRKGMPLSYLNAYEVGSKFRFSAVFSNATNAPGVLEIGQPHHRATEITIANLNDRLIPKQMVPYVGEDGELKVSAFYQEV